MWNKFYKNHSTSFFKDRHWTHREFPIIASPDIRVVLEVGCGVGNLAFPLAAHFPHLFFNLCDFSQHAIDLVKSNPAYSPASFNAFVADISIPLVFAPHIQPSSIDLCSCIFVLSAIPPKSLDATLANIHSVLKPDGVLILRDYAQNDSAQSRLSHRFSDSFRVRGDGTFAVFFDLKSLVDVIVLAGFELVDAKVIERQTENRKESLILDRLFVQATFRKINHFSNLIDD